MLRDRRGGVLAFVAVTMIAILAVLALCIDLAIAFTARGEAQRVADASSLAGASAFHEESLTPGEKITLAKERAREYGARNVVRNEPLDVTLVSSTALIDQYQDLTVQVIPDEPPGGGKVRVWVRHSGLATWFATMLGIRGMDIQAMAAAEASLFGETVEAEGQCLLPFAVVDIWNELATDEPCSGSGDDCDGDLIPNNGENWEFHDGDEYHVYHPDPDPIEYGDYADTYGTGLGSDLRNGTEDQFGNTYTGDYGRRFWIKAGPPGQGGKGGGGDAGGLDDMTAPGNFYLWDLPSTANGCDPNNAPTGMPWVETNILTCNECEVSTGIPYTTEPGNKAALKDEMEALYDTDPDAYWEPPGPDGSGCNCIKGSKHGDHDAAIEHSGRVRVVSMWDPSQGGDLRGRDQLVFNNFAKIFLEGGAVQPPDFQVYARFIGPVAGSGDAPPEGGGTLFKQLRLVE